MGVDLFYDVKKVGVVLGADVWDVLLSCSALVVLARYVVKIWLADELLLARASMGTGL